MIGKLLKATLPASTVEHLRRSRRRIKSMIRAIGSHGGRCPGLLNIKEHGGFKVAYRANTADEDVIGHSFENDIFFSALPEYEPAEGDTIIDIGAHIGTFTMLGASKVKNGKVFAVEASQDTFNYLLINAAINGLDNVFPRHVALSGSDGETTLYHDLVSGNWGHSIMEPLSREGEKVDTLSLQSFLERENITGVDLIKFNCEGAEFPIILATPVGILRSIRRLLILYHCDLAHDYSLSSLRDHLEHAGYKLRTFNDTGDRGWMYAER